MSKFKKILIKEQYDTSHEDVLNEFYKPVLEQSIIFDRAAGFFSSELLLESIDSLKIFVRKKGKKRYIKSPLLSSYELNDIKQIL